MKEITDAAYEKAVSAVAERAVAETRRAYASMITDYWNNQGMNDPELNRKTRQYVVKHLSRVIEKMKELSVGLTKRILRTMLDSDLSAGNKEPIRKSVMAKLDEAKKEAARYDRENRLDSRDTRRHLDLDR